MWDEASLGSAASRALRKLRGRGVDTGGTAALPVAARIQTNEPFWDLLWRATTGRRGVRFSYRAASTGDERVRTVQPWGMGSRFGHWYLVGFDVDRQAERWFRLTRITSEPTFVEGTYEAPADFSMARSLASLDTASPPAIAAVDIRPGTSQILRARPGATIMEGPEGWQRVTYSFSDQAAASGEVASLGPNARAMAPPLLVNDVRGRLAGALEALIQEPPSFILSARPAATGSSPGASTEDRLLRLLDLVPYFLGKPGVDVATAARDFKISETQLLRDLELLFVSGPRYYPDGLIDIHLEDGRIHVSDPQELSEPIRFGLDEVCALLVGLETLSALPGLPERSAVVSARNKLREATGEIGRPDRSIATLLTEDSVAPTLKLIRTAMDQQRQLRLSYVVAARDEITDRFVEPLRTFLQDDVWYLDAWCHSAQGRRHFRLDRIGSARLTDRPATIGPQHDDGATRLFDPSEADETVVLILAPHARWIAQRYAAQHTAELPDGRLAVEIRVAATGWLPGLIASLGGDCVVAAPDAVRWAAVAFTETALESYTGPGEA
nr:WYL domain-containing protein [Arthrobacter pigmenti]